MLAVVSFTRSLLERLRAFYRFAVESKWVADNPATKIKNPKVKPTPTMPFSQEEVTNILAACDQYPDSYGRVRQWNGRRLRALVLLLRYSGLRIGDAVCLRVIASRGTNCFSTQRRPARRFIAPCPNSSSPRSMPSNATMNITISGPALRRRTARRATTCGISPACSGLPGCSADTRTGSAIRSRWNCCWPGCPSNGSRCCWVTVRSGLRRNITPPGYWHGRGNWKPRSCERGGRTRLFSRQRRGRQRYKKTIGA